MSIGPAPLAPPRRLHVSAPRLDGWLATFVARHPGTTVNPVAGTLELRAPTGAWAVCQPSFPPWIPDPCQPWHGLVAHVIRPRRVGVLLVRLGGYAAGVFDGDNLITSKVGTRPVHGRNAAGGWSQQRFARRRENQLRVALQVAADTAVAVLLPHQDALDAVVTGGDRRALRDVLADPRLAGIAARVTGEALPVPDPRRRVLLETPRLFCSVTVEVSDPGWPEQPRG